METHWGDPPRGRMTDGGFALQAGFDIPSLARFVPGHQSDVTHAWVVKLTGKTAVAWPRNLWTAQKRTALLSPATIRRSCFVQHPKKLITGVKKTTTPQPE